MLTRIATVITLVLPLYLSALEPVPDLPPGKHWENFTILVWGFNTNAADHKSLYESVNLRGFHVDFKNEKLTTFGKETGWPFYVDHAAGKGYLHLKDPDAKKVTKNLGIVERPNSLSDPKTIETMKNLLTQNISAAKGAPALAYAFDDEISLGSFCSPAEVDGSPANVAKYRKHLEKVYGTIDKLNAQYGSTYSGFDAVQPRSYEDFRPTLTPNGLGKVNLSHWCDWRSFMDDTWAETLADLTRHANSVDSSVPAGFVGGHTPSAWGGSDYSKVTKAVQWMEAYDIGATNEILRSFWSQKRPHVQTFFSSGNPRSDSWFLWYYLSHGNRGVIVWPAFAKNGKEVNWFQDGKVQDNIVALAPTFKEVQGPLSQKIINGEFVHDPVAIYYSHPSIRVTWALDVVTHKRTWINRLSSMDNALATSSNTRIGWLKTLEDIGIQGKFIHQEHLLNGALVKDGYKVLLLNRVLCLSDAEAKAIREFADKGGVVIADHLCGIFDERGKARSTGALDTLFGIKRDLSKGILDGNSLTEIDGELGGSFNEKTWVSANVPVYKDLLVYERGLQAGEGKAETNANGAAAVVRNGKHVYLNLSTAGFLLKRPKGEGKEWLAFAADLFTKAGVTPRVKVSLDNKPAEQTETIFWKNGDTTTLCVIKNISRNATITSFGSTSGAIGDEKVKLKLVFANPVKNLKNERTGKELGAGKEFDDEFTPWEANVYTFQ
ncbi:MAG TPA: alpha-amylase family protein [Planctomycetota bacterium]|nr:alpha-amylase family protein [Planctomycetota bacterium]